MAASFSIPEQLQVVRALEPAADAAGRTGDYISLKHANKAWVVFFVDQGNAATIAVTIEKATAVAGTGSTAITTAVPIYAGEDLATTDVLTKQTDAVDFTTSDAVKHKMVIFEIDPAKLGDGYDCITVKTGASNAANITSALYLVQARNQGTTPASVIGN